VIGLVPEHCDTAKIRLYFLQQPHALGGQHRRVVRDAGDITSWPSQTRDQTSSNWITRAGANDGRHPGALHRGSSWITGDNRGVEFVCRDILGKLGQPR